MPLPRLLFALLLAGLFLPSCQSPVTIGESSFTLVAALDRTVLPDLKITSYRLTATGPSGGTRTATTTDGVFTFKGLTPGFWLIVIDGLDEQGTIVASGRVTTDIPSGTSNTTSTVMMAPVYGTGQGTVVISVTWPSGTAVDQVICYLSGNDGTQTVVSSVSLTVTATGASYSGQWKAGTYFARVEVRNRGLRVSAPRTETLIVVSGKVVAWSAAVTTPNLTTVWTKGDVKAVSAGGSRTMILKNDGSLWGVGSGPLGTPVGPQYRSTPVLVAQDVVMVSTGEQHTMFVKSDGSLWGCGSGKLGDGVLGDPKAGPRRIMSGVKMVSAGNEFTMILKTDDTLWAVGSNFNGRAGLGTLEDTSTPIQILSDVAHVAAGYSHTLIVKKDGSLWVTGQNNAGVLGNGVAWSTPTTTPTEVVSVGKQIKAAYTGYDSSLLLKADNTLWAAGASFTSTFTQVASSIASASVGQNHVFWITVGGDLYGLGSNSQGKLGLTSPATTSNPLLIKTGVSAVSAGLYHSAIVDTAGQVWTTGDGSSGQLGNQVLLQRAIPVQVAAAVSRVWAGGDQTFILMADATGTLQGVGSNSYGTLGDGTASRRTTFAPVLGLSGGIKTVAVGGSHTMILFDSGNLWGVGLNTNGILCSGTDSGSTTASWRMSDVRSVAAGYGYTMVVKTDGTLWAVGQNVYGQLGIGTTTTSTTLVQVPNMTGVAEVITGVSHTMILKTDGTLWACGSNDLGQLGDGTRTKRTSPVQIMTQVQAVWTSPASSNYAQTLVLKTDKTLWAFGGHSFGENGDRTVPTQVMSGVQSAAVGYGSALVLKSDGSLWGVGNCDFGQLGPGTDIPWIFNPVQVMTGVLAVSSGQNHTLILKTDGSLWATGLDTSGQLGLGTVLSTSTPTLVP